MEKVIKKYFGNLDDENRLYLVNLIESGKLKKYLLEQYPKVHGISSDSALYKMTMELKNRYLKKSNPLKKVSYSNKIKFENQALGLHTYRAKIHGRKVVSTNEIQIATLFKKVPYEFLEHVVIHELAHLKEKEHNKKFYQLCISMQGSYNLVSRDISFYLLYKDVFGEGLWVKSFK